MKPMMSLIGVSLVLMSAASAVHGRSPRPLEHFESDSAVVKQDVLELEEKASAEPVGKKDPSSGEAGRSAEADPKLSIADLIEAINQLEEKRGAAEATQQVKKAAPVQHNVKAAPAEKPSNWFNTPNLFAQGFKSQAEASQATTAAVPVKKYSNFQSNEVVGFRESEIKPEIVFGFNEDGAEKGLEEDEVCMTMLSEIEEIAYDDELTCVHEEFDSCHETFKSVLRKSMVEKCETDYLKECYIDYEIRANSVKVEVCKESWVRDCDETGDEVCTMEEDAVCEKEFHEITVQDMVTECETVDEEVCFTDPDTEQQKCKSFPKQQCKVVNKDRTEFVPEVKCKKLMTPVCGPESCPLTRSEPICSDEVKEVTVEVPRERCDLVPQKMCSQVPKFIPSIQPIKVCNKVPKEVCHKERKNPKSIKKNIPKKWCGKNKCEKNTQFGSAPYVSEIDASDARACSAACKDAANCDYFFWTGEAGIFGVEDTKNKCRFGQYGDDQTYVTIKSSMSALEGAVSGFEGCQIDI